MASSRSRKVDEHSIIQRTESVDVGTLQPYHENPRVGDVDAIAESLSEHGQYRPILVNIGSKTGRKNEVLAGNHTLLGTRKLGRKQIEASFIDVDETTAKKIVLADNKLADRGEYDNATLAQLLDSLPDISGTGYDQEEVDDILASIESDAGESMKNLDDFMGSMPDDYQEERKSQRDTIIEEETEERREVARQRGAERPADREEDKDVEDIDVSAELQVVLELKEDNVYMGENHWGVPELRPELLVSVDELPDNLKTWGGGDVTPDDGKTNWLYNYGLGSRKGLPMERTIMSFFCQDAKFMSWWDLPGYHVARYMTEGISQIIVPDFSFYDEEARAHHMQSQFRAQWMGRFFQEAGMKVIQRLQFDFTDRKYALEVPLLGLVRGADVIATSQQNMKDKKDEGDCAAVMAEALQELKPKILLVYGGPPAQRVGKAVAKHVEEVRWIENYAAVRRGTAFGKKSGGAKLSAKQKAALVEKHGGRATTQREADEQAEGWDDYEGED